MAKKIKETENEIIQAEAEVITNEEKPKKLYDIDLHDLTYADVRNMKKQGLDPRFWTEEERKDPELDEKWADFIISVLSERYPEVKNLGFRAAIQYATDAYVLTFGGEEALKN